DDHGSVRQLWVALEQVRKLRHTRVDRVERPVLNLHQTLEAILDIVDQVPACMTKQVLRLVDVKEDDPTFAKLGLHGGIQLTFGHPRFRRHSESIENSPSEVLGSTRFGRLDAQKRFYRFPVLVLIGLKFRDEAKVMLQGP